eukprot:TRINITY_DN1421_c0_g1_i1.p2 TRINITY_DN1421_c0_g1~~TRINITY_DN1421_c0_g1_i1.p2  ORF type:complete len:215 (+),score=51.05 TRINITY_DN1421_c0_g1_i1:2054-2698(+)
MQRHPEEVEAAYIITGLLGTGGFGMVYAATSKAPGNQKVAIKHFTNAFVTAGEALQKLYREVGILLRLNHPAIVTLLDVLLPASDNGAFLVFEPADMDLANFIRKHGILKEMQIATFGWQLFEGLDFLHTRNILHWDLKPEKILVFSGGTQLKIADFGLAPDVPLAGSGLAEEPMKSADKVTSCYHPPELLLNPRESVCVATLCSFPFSFPFPF